MKKLALLALSLGMAVSSQAQGYFNFNNDTAYTGAANGQLITIGALGKAGQGTAGQVVGSGAAPAYSIGFLWADGTSFSDAAAFENGLGANGGVTASFLAPTGDLVNGAGIFDAGKAILNGTVDGQNITVQAVSWFNPDGTTTYAASKAAGNNVGFSSLMTVRLAAGADNIVGDLGGMQGFTVQPVPEPTVFALAGLGAAALMIVRRRK
jgi:hypothetical protein